MTKEETIKRLKEAKSTIQPFRYIDEAIDYTIKALEQEPQTGKCKDCKWWKDSDGVYRRGRHAESLCPINHEEVYKGNGYCFMYEPQESEE